MKWTLELKLSLLFVLATFLMIVVKDIREDYAKRQSLPPNNCICGSK